MEPQWKQGHYQQVIWKNAFSGAFLLDKKE